MYMSYIGSVYREQCLELNSFCAKDHRFNAVPFSPPK
jgi:hypothetical protein